MSETSGEQWERIKREGAIRRRFDAALAEAAEALEDGDRLMIASVRAKMAAAIEADRKAHERSARVEESARREPQSRQKGKITMYEKKGEWNGYTVHGAATGYVVDFWSREQGARDGMRVLVPFGQEFPKGMDLADAWNETTCGGDAIARAAGVRAAGAKMLRRGNIVQ